jgi:choline dehydrogenase-like flavoprotein
MASPTPETLFTRDILGNFVCNTFAEAMNSGPFDVVIIGGGTFGLALAQDLFYRSRTTGLGTIPEDRMNTPPNFRILVLEAGPFTLCEHVQDIPNLGLSNPGPQVPFPAGNGLPATRQELIAQNNDKKPVSEVWGLPWNSNERFGGMAYCLGGRSLYFGGWSPRYLDTEMPTQPAGSINAQTLWPPVVVEDLKSRFFLEGAQQTGVSAANDFLNGNLQDFFRRKMFTNYGAIPNAVPLAEQPDYVVEAPQDITPGLALQLASPPYPGFQDSLKLDAPLSVQALSRPGFFPFNKFSSVPLGITAARQAFFDSANNNANKRLMIVPNCHVKSLRTRTYTLATGASVQEVDGVDTSNGFIDLSGAIAGNLNRRPKVVLAAGAIESARLALVSVSNIPNAGNVGGNFMVHLRKNVNFTAAPNAIPTLTAQELCVLLVRCRALLTDGTPVHYHLQITSSAVPAGSGAGKSDALLFQNVPDLDNFRYFTETAPGEVDVSIRAVGEMLPNQPNNRVSVPLTPPDNDEYTIPRATVNVVRSQNDTDVMNLINSSINAVAQTIFGTTINAAAVQPDGLGTTFHESGTLRMGNNPSDSVVNADGQFHYVTNLYAGDASVLPTCGSANPVMNGIALQRRLAKRLVPEGDGIGNPNSPGRRRRPFHIINMPPAAPAAGTVLNLFDGTTLSNWRMAGRGTFHVIDGALQSLPSFDLGLYWCTIPMPENYLLELDFFTRTPQTNAGIFVRFRNPESTGYYNPAWSSVFMPGVPVTASGFEIQIDNTGAPDGRLKHKTGAVYAVNYPNDAPHDPQMPAPTVSDFVNAQNAQIMAWNHYKIEVLGDVISVNLNGVNTAKYTNTDPNRGRFSLVEPTFIGLQAYSNYSFTTAFRQVRATVL